MNELYELGIIFRGFILVNHIFKDLNEQKLAKEKDENFRGAFISAIDSFAKNLFNNLSLEYLEADNILFIFKRSEIKTSDGNREEPIILYCLTDKTKKDIDKFVKKVLEKVEIILQLFISRYGNKDFSELSQFEPFKKEIKNFFD